MRLRQAAGKKLSAAASAVLRVPRVGVRSLVVTLNGTRVQVPAGARLLDLARSGALRRGSNRLRVQLLMTDGRIGELARTFSLGRLRNVAVARLRGRAAVGRTMVLDGGRSLTLPGLRRAAGFAGCCCTARASATPAWAGPGARAPPCGQTCPVIT